MRSGVRSWTISVAQPKGSALLTWFDRLAQSRRTNRWTGATGSDSRIKRDPGKAARQRRGPVNSTVVRFFFWSMANEIKESDWKLFRQLHPVALERFCERVLAEVQAAVTDTSECSHDRYLKLFDLVRERDKTIGRLFNDP